MLSWHSVDMSSRSRSSSHLEFPSASETEANLQHWYEHEHVVTPSWTGSELDFMFYKNFHCQTNQTKDLELNIQFQQQTMQCVWDVWHVIYVAPHLRGFTKWKRASVEWESTEVDLMVKATVNWSSQKLEIMEIMSLDRQTSLMKREHHAIGTPFSMMT